MVTLRPGVLLTPWLDSELRWLAHPDYGYLWISSPFFIGLHGNASLTLITKHVSRQVDTRLSWNYGGARWQLTGKKTLVLHIFFITKTKLHLLYSKYTPLCIYGQYIELLQMRTCSGWELLTKAKMQITERFTSWHISIVQDFLTPSFF